MAFYDQRSHGRSQRSDREHATSTSSATTWPASSRRVAPQGQVVLVGHSMGGMSIIAFAERHPKLFAQAGRGRRPDRHHRRRPAPASHGQPVDPRRPRPELVAPRVIAALAKAPELVDSARRPGSNIGFIVADMFAFGRKDVPAAEVEFLDEMLAGTTFDVLAEFFPNFTELDKFEHLVGLRTTYRPRSSAAPRTSSPRSGTAARWPTQLPTAHAGRVPTARGTW